MDVPTTPHIDSKPRGRALRGMLYLAVLTALLLSAWSLLPQTVGEHLRRSFVETLSERYPDFDVTLRRATVVPSMGIVLEGLKLQHRGHARPRYIAIDQVICESEIDFERILESPLRPTRIIASGLDVLMGPDDDNHWPLSVLIPDPQTPTSCPVIELRDGRIRLVAKDGNDIECHQVHGAIRAGDDEKHFQLTAASGLAEKIQISGVTTAGGPTQLSFRIDQARIDRELCMSIPQLKRSLESVDSISGTVTAAGTVHVDPAQGNDFAIRLAIANGQFAHTKLERSVHEISATMILRPEGVQIEQAEGSYGTARCTVRGKVNGLTLIENLTLDVSVSQFDLNNVPTLPIPSAAKERFSSLQPRGMIDARGRLAGAPENLRFEGSCDLRDVAFTHWRFPYPIKDINGTLQIGQDKLFGKGVVGRIGGQRAEAELEMAFDGAYRIAVQTDGPIPIDTTLLDAFTPRGEPASAAERFFRSLSPGGSIHVVSAHLSADRAGNRSQRITLDVLGGSLRYNRFPYPISDIRGRIAIADDQVMLSGFHGQSNDSAVIHAEGTYYLEPRAETDLLDLTVVGFAIPLDNTLRAALSTPMRSQWDALTPGGTLDRLEMQIRKTSKEAETDFQIAAHQYESAGARRPTITLRPTPLPYAVEVVRGTLVYADDLIDIQRLDARHGASTLSTTGRCQKRDNGDWQLMLDILPPSRIWMDGDLLAALPDSTREGLRSLDLRGPIALRGMTRATLPATRQTDAPVDDPFFWDLLLQMEGNQLGDGEVVGNLRGEIAVSGRQAAGELTASGSVEFDSAHLLGIQVTSLRGDFAIEKGRLMLGRAVPLTAGMSPIGEPPPLSGRVFDGQLLLDGLINLSESERPFDVTLSLKDAALARVLTELNGQKAAVEGVCGGTLRLIGMMNRWRNMTGRGTAYIRDAKLYQTPVIVQLLNLLQINPNEDAAFTTGDFRYRVDGDRLAFDQIELSGGFIELHGGGTINDRKELDLAFETRVSPKSAWYHFVVPLQSDRYNLYGIRVTGSLEAPELEKRALPQIEEALQNLLPTPGTTPNRTRPPNTARPPAGGRRR